MKPSTRRKGAKMATREAAVFQRLKGHITRPGDRFERIENGLVAGFPDVNYCFVGVEGWIELKAPRVPAREDTRLMGDDGMRIEQSNWMLAQKNAKGRAWLFIATEVRLLLISKDIAAQRDKVNNMTLSQLIRVATWQVQVPVREPTAWIRLRMDLVT